jgi:drug/metabolite transporter (DMT)-like permease
MAFRSFNSFKINTLPAIITNYLVCVITGVFYTGTQTISSQINSNSSWLYAAALLGVIFVTTFYLMARTTQVRGVAVATVASKMSLAIPVIFSLFVFKIGTNSIDNWNYIGIALAFIAIYMVTKKSNSVDSVGIKALGLPLLVFLMGGVIDTGLNYVNLNFLVPELESIFPIFIFGFAFSTGIIIAAIQKTKPRIKDIVGGIYLGIPNYFSIYFQLKALSAYDNNGALVYPSLNIGIIIFSTLAAIIFYKEKLSKINWLGIFLSVLVIFLLSHQEILSYF